VLGGGISGRDRVPAGDAMDAAQRRGRRALATGARVEPAVGEGPGALIADYGALREQTPSRERTRRLGDLLVRLLRASGIEAALRDQEPLVVVFRHDGQQFAMGVSWASEAGGQAADEFARAVRQAALAASVVLLSMSGFTGGRSIRWACRR